MAKSVVVNFAAGERTKRIDISLINDNIVEATETLMVDLSSPSGGTTVPGVNYTPVSGTLNFADGQRQAYFDIPLINNKTYGGTKTLNVQLTNPTGGALLGNIATGLVSILDDESP